MPNAAQDVDEYLAGLSDEWLFCRGWGHDWNKPSVRRRKSGPKAYEEIFDHAEANFGTRVWCENGCGYHILVPVFVGPDLKIVELEEEKRYENPDYCVAGFRVSRAEARAEWYRREATRVAQASNKRRASGKRSPGRARELEKAVQ